MLRLSKSNWARANEGNNEVTDTTEAFFEVSFLFNEASTIWLLNQEHSGLHQNQYN